jgi:hypothetical protein
MSEILLKMIDVDLFGVTLIFAIVLFNAGLCYSFVLQDRARYRWGTFQWGRLGIAILCWLSSGVGILGSCVFLLPIFAWIWLLIMTGFWVVNIPLERFFIKLGILLGLSSWSLFLYGMLDAGSELLILIVFILPVTVLAVFVSRFHYLDLADFSDSPSN